MKQLALRSILIIGVICVICSSADAQWRSESNVSPLSSLFSPSAPPPGGENVWDPKQSSVLVSGFIGFNHNTNLGDFSADCDCSFDGKVGLLKIGVAVGGDVTYVFSRTWAVMAKLYYDDKHTTESYEADIEHPIKYNNSIIIRPVRMQQDADVTLSYFTFGAFLRYQPRLERWFAYIGPAVGYNLTGKIEQTQQIVTSELTFIEGGNEERIVSQKEIDQVSKIRAEGMLGVGYEYMLGPRLFLSPEFQVAFPITKVGKPGSVNDVNDNWRVATVRLSVGLKYVAF